MKGEPNKTRNTAGMCRHAKSGHRLPFWMMCRNSLDSLWWAKISRDFARKTKIQ
jgi:hypothetical protein